MLKEYLNKYKESPYPGCSWNGSRIRAFLSGRGRIRGKWQENKPAGMHLRT